jgi:hypothetical protein
MINIIRNFALILFVTVSLALVGAQAQSPNDALSFLRGIYNEYILAVKRGGEPRISRSIYTLALQRLWKQVDNQSECRVLNFDPLIDAQDYMLQSVNLKILTRSSDRLTANASFRNGPLDPGNIITFDLIATQGTWKIDNITYKDGSDLRSSLVTGLRECKE